MPCFFFCFLVPDLRCWSTSSCGGWQRTMLVGVFHDVNCQICPNHHTLVTSNKVLKSVLPFDLTLPMPQLWNRNQTTSTPHSAAVVQSHVQIQQVLRCESACRVMGGPWEALWSQEPGPRAGSRRAEDAAQSQPWCKGRGVLQGSPERLYWEGSLGIVGSKF